MSLSKGSTSVGAFSDPCHLRIDVELAAEMLCFSCTLDDGQRLKEGCLWISFIFIGILLRYLVFRKMCTVLQLSFSRNCHKVL